MHIQENKVKNKPSSDYAGPKHFYSGGRDHQAKHAQEVPKKRNRGIAVFVVSFVLFAALILLRQYAVCFVPSVLSIMVLSICAVVRRSTFFSVTALVASALLLTLTAGFIVLTVYESVLGISVFSFSVF